MAIKIKILVEKKGKAEIYFTKLDKFIGNRIGGGKLGKWHEEHQPRDLASFIWYYDDWTIFSSVDINDRSKPSEFIFKVMNEMNDKIVFKRYKFDPINIKTDYNLYMKYLKEIMKLAEKKIK